MNISTEDYGSEQRGWHSNRGYMLFCRAIHDNRLKAGMILTQNQLAEILGLSLSPLRETLVLLEDSGLVEIKPRTGIRIFYPEVTFIRENMQFRSMVEVFALPVFMRNMEHQWIERSRAAHLELLAKWDGQKGDRSTSLESLSQDLDWAFHSDIVDALANGTIKSAYRRARENVHLARKVHQTSFGKSHYKDTIAEHLKVLDAMEEADGDGAMKALEEHFGAATHRLFVAP